MNSFYLINTKIKLNYLMIYLMNTKIKLNYLYDLILQDVELTQPT